MKFCDALDRYLSEILITKSKNHQVMSTQELRYWEFKFGSRALSKITPSMIRENLPQSVGPATKNRYLCRLSALYTTCIIDWELVKENPVSKIRKFTEPRGRTRYLSDEERQRLLASCRTSKHPYLHVIVVIALSTGMRRSEIITLTWSQIDLHRQTITLWTTKNKEPRVVPLLGKSYDLVSNLPRSSRKLFPGSNIRYYWEKALKEAGISDFRFHDLRHTAGSYLAQQGVPLLTIGNILGHRSIATTTKYTHLSVDHLKTPLSNLNDMMFP